MRIISFTGKSGTGKSYQATQLAQSRGIDAIIDDGLLIYKGQIVAGSSAKKCASKAAAMRTALFNYDDQRASVIDALIKYKPETLMILGTSDRMTDIIADQLRLHAPEERIYIEDVTTEEERQAAAHHRNNEGEHVIPAPVGQLRRDFAGYFMNPLRYIMDFARGNALSDTHSKAESDDPTDRTVVRPKFSYFGTFSINEQVIRDIIAISAEKYRDYLRIAGRMSNGKTQNMSLTIDVRVLKDEVSVDKCIEFQRDVYDAVVNMTAFTVESVNVRISGIARDSQDLHTRKLH